MSVNRRDFLKSAGSGLLGLVAGNLVNSEIYKAVERPVKELNIDQKDAPLGIFIDKGYPTVPWVLANMAVAAKKLDGLIIASGEELSLLKTLFDDDKLDYKNTDPNKGFVIGLDPANPLNGLPASGVCQVATTLFRGALYGAMKINESYSHYGMHPTDSYFRNMPFGTDSSIYLDPENNIAYDLKIANPWNFPVRLDYRLFDENGNAVDMEKVLDHKITGIENLLSLWQKYIEGGRQAGIPITNGALPSGLVIRPVSTAVRFVPTVDLDSLPKWRSEVKLTDAPNDEVIIDRRLFINEVIVDNYQRKSNYR